MKKKVTFYIDDSTIEYQYLQMLGHKKGDVLGALVIQNLKKNGGFTPSDVVALSRYHISKKDMEFAQQYFGDISSDEVQVSRTTEIKNKPKKKKTPQKDKVTKPKETVNEIEEDTVPAVHEETVPDDTDDGTPDPSVENKVDMSLVMKGMSAFMQE